MNTNNKNMSPTSRAKSFTYATNGLWQLLRQEPNAKLHAIATVVVLAAGIVRHIQLWQWIALVFAIGLVWITEALNTCIEKLCDFCCDNKFHPAIKIIKDISAAAVLLAAGVSLAVAFIIFFL
jgi:diacylglycerol kinase